METNANLTKHLGASIKPCLVRTVVIILPVTEDSLYHWCKVRNHPGLRNRFWQYLHGQPSEMMKETVNYVPEKVLELETSRCLMRAHLL